MASIAQPSQPIQTQSIETFIPDSSFISALEYDPAQLRLTTHLKNGAIYQHAFVMGLEWESLKTAQNHGRHWSRNIKGKKAGIRVKVQKAPNSLLKGKRRKV